MCVCMSVCVCVCVCVMYVCMYIYGVAGVYCLWVAWSLFDALKDGTEQVLSKAGYDEYDLEARRIYMASLFVCVCVCMCVCYIRM